MFEQLELENICMKNHVKDESVVDFLPVDWLVNELTSCAMQPPVWALEATNWQRW